MKEYLEKVVDEKYPIDKVIFNDILINAHTLKAPEKAYNKLIDYSKNIVQQGLSNIDEDRVDKGVCLMCRIVRALVFNQKNENWAMGLMDFLKSDEAVWTCYAEISRTWIEAFGDKKMARHILKKAEEIITKKQSNLLVWFEEDYDPPASVRNMPLRCHNLIQRIVNIALCVMTYLEDRKWAVELVGFAEKEANCLDDYLELGDFHVKYFDDKGKGREFFKRAYDAIEYKHDLYQLAGDVLNLLKDKEWGKELIEESLKKAKNNSYDLYTVAEIMAKLDRERSAELFKKSLINAKNPREIIDIVDSMKDCLGEEMAEKILREMKEREKINQQDK